MEIYIDENKTLKSYDDDVKFSPIEIRAKFEEWLNTLEIETKKLRFIQFLNKGFKEIEAKGEYVKSVHMSAIVFSTLKTIEKDYFEEATQKEIVDRGVYGRLWLADVVAKSKSIAVDVVIRSKLGEKVIFSTEKYIKK